jgi:hypothetical protein
MKATYSIAAVGCALVLSACGGGGGGGTGTTPVQASGPYTITAADAPKAAHNSYAAGSLVGGWSGPLLDLMGGVSVTPADTGVVSPVLDLVRRAYDSKGGNLLTGVAVTQMCPRGGSLTVDGTIHDQTTVSNGDTLTINAVSCVLNEGTASGKLSIKASGVTGDVFNDPTGTLTLDATFNDFSLESGGMIHIVTGDMKFDITGTSTTDGTFAVSGGSLQVTEQRLGATVASLALTQYAVSTAMHSRTGTTTANFKVSGTADGIGQFAYTVKNLQPFVRTTGSAATSGAMIVYGGTSSVTATVVSSGVRVDYRANSDGGVTQSSTQSWSDFSAGF